MTKTKHQKQSSTNLPSHDRFFNRELSWLHFNERVLAQAADIKLPLLERLRFLGIFASNLDEFFMKRVGGLKRQIRARVTPTSLDGLTPRQQLRAIREALDPLLARQEKIFLDDLQPALKKHNIELVRWNDLNNREKRFASAHFHERVFPTLTPLAVDAGHPFPFISNLSTSLGIALAHPESDETLFARIKISGLLPQWLALPTKGDPLEASSRFLSLQELVTAHLSELFPHMTILASMPFRVTRNADLDVIADDDADDLLEIIEEELRQRRFAEVVRLEHGPDPDPWILGFLMEELQLHPHDVYEVRGGLDFSDLGPVFELEMPQLHFKPWSPVTPAPLVDEPSFFHAVRARDILVHHPYESFSSSVERFVREAAADSRVLSIKMTVYRLGDDSPLIPILIRAAENGKQVVCLVELKARFDEARNIYWAQTLEEAGVHVVYGLAGLKTHAKTLLVVRNDIDGVRCYAHIGTGNYHATTANLYTDMGLFTCKPEYTTELVHLFNFLTGRSRKENYRTLLVAPLTMEARFLESLQRERHAAKKGQPAHVIAKMNGLEDSHIIEALYEASCSGVKIDLIVRGICCLRPKVPGMSENIRVYSVLGRFLEHSRIFYFRNGAKDPVEGEFYLGSADWMSRNLHYRLEVAIPLFDQVARQRCWDSLQVLLNDSVRAWELQPDGSYLPPPLPGRTGGDSHSVLMQQASAIPGLSEFESLT